MLLACVGRPASEIDRLAAGVHSSDDPEANYLFAGHLAYCRQSDEALAMLRRAIEGGLLLLSCARHGPVLRVPALNAGVRTDPFRGHHSPTVKPNLTPLVGAAHQMAFAKVTLPIFPE